MPKILLDEGDSVTRVTFSPSWIRRSEHAACSGRTLAKTKADYERSRASVKEGLVAPVEFETRNTRMSNSSQRRPAQRSIGQYDGRAPLSGIVTKKMAQVGQSFHPVRHASRSSIRNRMC